MLSLNPTLSFLIHTISWFERFLCEFVHSARCTMSFWFFLVEKWWCFGSTKHSKLFILISVDAAQVRTAIVSAIRKGNERLWEKRGNKGTCGSVSIQSAIIWIICFSQVFIKTWCFAEKQKQYLVFPKKRRDSLFEQDCPIPIIKVLNPCNYDIYLPLLIFYSHLPEIAIHSFWGHEQRNLRVDHTLPMALCNIIHFKFIPAIKTFICLR